MTELSAQHTPVMIREVREGLHLSRGDCFVDCTLGLGGHAYHLAADVGVEGRIIGLDRDQQALDLAKQRLKDVGTRCDFVHRDFRYIDQVLTDLQVSEVNGILFDLGVSSLQLDTPERGFSFRTEGPLDMRMDQENFISAYDLVNSLSEKEISMILKQYGEERWHNRIAHYLVEHRPLQTTTDLREAVIRAIPHGFQHQKIHPATRTFQAFRIVVNRELEAVETALERCIPYLKPGGRICVVAFHSLEDRIVKHQFRDLAKKQQIRLVTKKPLGPSPEESFENPRARSARLRVAEKI